MVCNPAYSETGKKPQIPRYAGGKRRLTDMLVHDADKFRRALTDIAALSRVYEIESDQSGTNCAVLLLCVVH